MKNSILLVLLILLGKMVSGQGFQGIATYKTHRKVDLKISQGGNTPSAEMQKQFEEQFKKQFQKTFKLNFTQYESTYKQDEELATPQLQQQGGVMLQVIGSGGGSDILYKNLKRNQYRNKTEIMGKLFLINDTIGKRDWKLTGDTKNIGQYTCYKATASREEERTQLSVNDGKTSETKVIDTVITTAWYTPQIPVSNGPGLYGGLPGLILEVNEGNLTIVCSEIILNPEETISIDVPDKGKEVTQAEFDEIMEKKSKEMMERYRDNSRKKDGNTIEIKIGG